MDTFFEQIVPIRKNGKGWAAVIGIWLAAVIIVLALFLFALPYLGMIAFLLFVGVFFGAYKLSSRFSVEYEYIITNGILDVDRITAKSSRKRVLSLDIANVERLEKYNPASRPVGNFKQTLIACNEVASESENQPYFLVSSGEESGNVLLVFAPDERLRGAMVKFLPKYIANSAFK